MRPLERPDYRQNLPLRISYQGVEMLNCVARQIGECLRSFIPTGYLLDREFSFANGNKLGADVIDAVCFCVRSSK